MGYEHFRVYCTNKLVQIFLEEEFHSDVIDKKILKLGIRVNSKVDRVAIRAALIKRGVRELYHFTPLSNIKNISRFGLIPREYLKLPVMRKYLTSTFSDSHRQDKREHLSCLSVSHPNYKMFYSKREKFKGYDWVVCEIEPYAMEYYFSEFCVTNMASGAGIESGVEGFELMFEEEVVRTELKLPDNYPTDPQSELLIGSFIPASHICKYHVETQSALEKLKRIGLDAKISPEIFGPRHDYAYWKGKSILDYVRRKK